MLLDAVCHDSLSALLHGLLIPMDVALSTRSMKEQRAR
jgi:hypothetical protein